jgi:hypothetical protein
MFSCTGVTYESLLEYILTIFKEDVPAVIQIETDNDIFYLLFYKYDI